MSDPIPYVYQEYPRLVYKDMAEQHKKVFSDDERDAAVAEGWSLEVPAPAWAVPAVAPEPTATQRRKGASRS